MATVAYLPQWLKNHLAFIEAMAVETIEAVASDVLDRTHPPLLAFPCSLDPFTIQEIVSDHVEACIEIENIKVGDVPGFKARVVQLAGELGWQIIL